MKLLSLAVLCIAFLVPAGATHAARPHTPTWASCTIHLDWQTRTRVTARQCVRYAMPKHTGQRVVGHVKTCRQQSPHVRVCVRFPQFYVAPTPQPAPPSSNGYWETAHVTGYCLTGMMADGAYVHWGAVANNVLAFGTGVEIPSLGFSGSIQDRGDGTMGTTGLDIWTPSCAQAYTFTGWRSVLVTP